MKVLDKEYTPETHIHLPTDMSKDIFSATIFNTVRNNWKVKNRRLVKQNMLLPSHRSYRTSEINEIISYVRNNVKLKNKKPLGNIFAGVWFI